MDAEILPFDLPLHGAVGALGVGLAAFLVTAALAGRAGVADLARRSVRWRVPVRWYLVALLTVPVGATLIPIAIYGPRALGRRLVAGLARLQRSPPSFCCSWCCFSLPKRSDSPDSSNTIGRTDITP